MNEKKLIDKYLLYFILTVSSAIVIVILLSELFFAPKFTNDAPRDFNNNWSVYYNGLQYLPNKINRFHLPKTVERGDIVLLKNKIPSNTPDNQSIAFYTFLSGVRAFIDGKEVFRSGYEEATQGKMAPNAYSIIPIPDGSDGKTVVIELTPSETNAFTNIGKIVFVRSDLALYSLTYAKRGPIFVGTFLITLGLVYFIIGVSVIAIRKRADPIIHIGALSFFVGLWSLCSENLLTLFNLNRGLTTASEYIALYGALIPALFLIKFFLTNESSSQFIINTCSIMIIISILFFMIAFFLHVINLVHFTRFLVAYHIMVCIMFAAIFLIARYSIRQKSIGLSLVHFGMIEFCFAAMVDLIRFNIQKYLTANDASSGISLLPYGTLLFVIMLFTSYLFRSYTEMSKRIAADTEKEILRRMAYNDRLTGLYNRTKGEEIFQKLDEEIKDYSIVSIDLNGLKKINDTYGHRKGDLLLVTFSKILTESFKNIGICVRMGGDEFMVVIYEENQNQMEQAINTMIKRSVEESKANNITVDASYGSAMNTEAGLQSSEEVYKLADQRMYKMKVESKKNRTD